jgi:hypothetical protein
MKLATSKIKYIGSLAGATEGKSLPIDLKNREHKNT